MKLIIFDLDQTLVDLLSVHDEATQRLFKRLFDTDAKISEIDFSGNSLTENFREMAKVKNIPDRVFDEKSSQLLNEYEITFGESLPSDATKYVLPGVRELLGKLSGTSNVLALYTGDSPGIVKRVFRATDLGKYFQFVPKIKG